MTDYTNLPSGSQALDAGLNVDGIRAAQSLADSPKHLSWPLRLVAGPQGSQVLATVEQDTLEDVTQSVQLLLSTHVGERYRDAPDFGVEELVSGDPINIAMATQAVATWEPRASVVFTVDPIDGSGAQYVRVDVQLVEGSADVTPAQDH